MWVENLFSLRVSVCGTQFAGEHWSDCNDTYCVLPCHTAAETDRQVALYNSSNQAEGDLCYGVRAGRRA